MSAAEQEVLNDAARNAHVDDCVETIAANFEGAISEMDRAALTRIGQLIWAELIDRDQFTIPERPF